MPRDDFKLVKEWAWSKDPALENAVQVLAVATVAGIAEAIRGRRHALRIADGRVARAKEELESAEKERALLSAEPETLRIAEARLRRIAASASIGDEHFAVEQPPTHATTEATTES